MSSNAGKLLDDINNLKAEIETNIKTAKEESSLEEIRLSALGKKGKLTSILKGLASLSPEEKSEIGKAANELKSYVENELSAKKESFEELYYEKLAKDEWYDVTVFPPRFPEGFLCSKERGRIHPISITQNRLEEIFTSMGFSILDGPQVETDFHNFGALNFTDDHPAREMQDTFYTEQNHLLRTHTSAVQARGLKSLKPPMRIIVPGRVFRYEEVDASHEHTFYQMEGMIIDKEVSVSHLLFLMHTLLDEIFKRKVEIRLRPGYFPFVEPGFELDMRCLVCGGDGCPVCKKTGWVEVLPCGLVHPNVIKTGGLDPEKWQGAAFGLGLNRLVMMEHGIEDIRYFQNTNMSFLTQFN
ncbi:MAG: phenylalanine--tRNA ligase subunit alpha [Spirochaetia bacterium]|nr:phenylalanine--tRNA ligase subunit alpha [Spirochaetia bacterium]